jgi:Ran GTPase-activating protein (RanGAP) involved in mRNA processing and transport
MHVFQDNEQTQSASSFLCRLVDIPTKFHPSAFQIFIQSMTVHTSVRIPMRSVVVAGKQLRSGLAPPLTALFQAVSARTGLRMLTLAGSSSAREWPQELMTLFETSLCCLKDLETLSLQDGFLDPYTGPATARVLPHLTHLTSIMLEQPKSDELASCKALLEALSHARHVAHVSVTGLHRFHAIDKQTVNKPLVGALVSLLQSYKGGSGRRASEGDQRASAQLPLKLVSLNLTGSAITAADIAALQAPLSLYIPFCTELINLKELNLRGNQLRDAGAKALAPLLKCLPKLEHLDVCDNKIESEGAKALAPVFKTLTRLRYIDMSSNWLTDSPASYVAIPDIDGHCIAALARSWICLMNLEYLELGECCYDEAVAIRLAPVIAALSRLQHLGLRSWCIGGLDLDIEGNDTGTAEDLSKALALSCSLQHLDMHDSGLDGHDLCRLAPSLAYHGNLTCLDLQVCSNHDSLHIDFGGMVVECCRSRSRWCSLSMTRAPRRLLHV